MSLVTLAIAAGITTAVRVYRQISLKADAQTLLGTSIAALNADFASADLGKSSGFAAPEEPVDSITFYSLNRGYRITIQNGQDTTDSDGNKSNPGIQLTASAEAAAAQSGESGGDSGSEGQSESTVTLPLISSRAATFDLYTKISNISLHSGPTVGTSKQYQYFEYTIEVYSASDPDTPIEAETVKVDNISQQANS